jgi:small ligand-binding sensory domain FIST
MPFFATHSKQSSTAAALDQVTAAIDADWTGAVDVALVFFSPHHSKQAGEIAVQLTRRLTPRALLGCSGESIVANGHEIEDEPALAVWLGRWKQPPTFIPFHLTMEQTSEGYSVLGFPDEWGAVPAAESFLLTLGDPFTFPVDDFLGEVNREQKGLVVVGGMASGAQQPGQNRLLLGDRAVGEGAVCLLVHGAPPLRTVVSQGCRPIGKPMVITKGQRNLIMELGGRPALEQLQQLWQELPPRDQQLVQEGLHVGRVINEYQEAFQRGDFLVRNVMGLDRDSGAIAITDRVRVGQTIQFHVRDAETADEDLRLLLEMNEKRGRAAAGWLFTCNGRGSRLFDVPDHDAAAIQGKLGSIPLAGFFAQGELGPIGGQNFIHGFTASVVLFDE